MGESQPGLAQGEKGERRCSPDQHIHGRVAALRVPGDVFDFERAHASLELEGVRRLRAYLVEPRRKSPLPGRHTFRRGFGVKRDALSLFAVGPDRRDVLVLGRGELGKLSAPRQRRGA